jgi:ribosome-associated protein YbcJ (S4-like RNA binding protein)
MDTDYSFLTQEYPEVISMEQLYHICHISKRKAKWLLENGYIPCQDSGKKTRRFKIRVEDVINYLTALESAPDMVRTPVGAFNNKAKRPPHPISQVSPVEFKEFLREKWTASPDALTARDIRQLTGYHLNTIGQWICQGKLMAVQTQGSTLVAMEWLVDFITEYTINHPNRLSTVNGALAREYLQKENSK